MGTTTPAHQPTALLSWAHRDPELTAAEAEIWKGTVTEFAKGLRTHGIDVKFDLWHQETAIDWTRWGQRMVEECDFVIVAMDTAWADRWRGLNDPRQGAGVVVEADTLKGLLDTDQLEFNRRTIIALLDGRDSAVIPLDLRRLNRFPVSTIDRNGLDRLLRALFNDPEYPIPDLGEPSYSWSATSEPAAGRDAIGRGEADLGLNPSTFDRSTTRNRAPLGHRSAFPPNQLPMMRQRLVNRSSEVVSINSTLTGSHTASGTPIVVLAGGPGVGKSALGQHWSVTHRGDFTGGQLYASLNDFRLNGGLAVGEVLGYFLRAFGIPEHSLDSGLAERTRLFREETAQGKVLVFLDDIRYPAELAPLIPAGPGSAVIVTCRHSPEQLISDGASLVEIEPLTDNHASALLREVVGEERVHVEPHAVRRLKELCCGLPIALNICAARLASRPRLTIQALVDDLEDAVLRRLSRRQGTRQTSVQACFDSSYLDLGDDEKAVYRIVGLHPGLTFSDELVRSAADKGLDVAEVLDELAGAHLIEDLGDRRYRMHDLLRAHTQFMARSELSLTDGEALMQKIIDYYVGAAQKLDRTLIHQRLRLAPHINQEIVLPGDRRAAFQWFETERANIVAALRTAFEQGANDAVWQIAEALWPAYDYHKHLEEAAEIFGMAATAAQRSSRPDAEARMRAQLARTMMDRGDQTVADETIALAVRLSIESRNLHLQASIIEWQGVIHMGAGRWSAAVGSFESSRRAFDAIGEHRGVALQDYLLGKALLNAGQHEQAIESLNSAALNGALQDDDLMLVRIELCRGLAYLSNGDTELARRTLGTTVTRAEALGADDCVATASEAAAEAALAADDHSDAQRHLRRALSVYAPAHHPRALVIIRALEADEPPD